MGTDTDAYIGLFGRCLLFVYFLIYLHIGLALLIAGIVLTVALADFNALLGPLLLKAPIVLSVTGALLLFSAVPGCGSIFSDKPKLILILFCALATLGFILTLVAMSLALHDKSQVGEPLAYNFVSHSLTQRIEKDMGDAVIRSAFDKLQTENHCCGISGPMDWSTNDQTEPASCCDPMLTCNRTVSPASGVYLSGCASQLSAKIRSKLVPVAVVSAVAAVIEFFGLIFVCCVTCLISDG